MHIGIIGTGYVGLVTGACFSEFGVFVTCIDKDENKVARLKQGTLSFYEPGLEALVQKSLKEGRLQFSTQIANAVKDALVVFIAVGTPPRGDGSSDLSDIEEVASEIARHIDGYKVIVTKSTVPIGTGKLISQIISRHLKEQVDFDIASNPEFLREGSAIEDFMRPDRVIIGARSQQAIAILKDLYRPLYLIETPFVITDIETAEIIKYASNAFLATKISFINELSGLCEKVGGDIQVIAKGMGLDKRIGSKFLHAGPGFGGSCFPKDTKALIKIGEEHGVELGIVSATVHANQRQVGRIIERLRGALDGFSGKTVAILGLSFKPNTDDIREAPSLPLIESVLMDEGMIRAYDPAAMENVKAIHPQIIFSKDAYDAVNGADALVIVTEWNQFRNLDFDRIKAFLKRPLLFDLRNIYDPEKMRALGFDYHSIGRQ